MTFPILKTAAKSPPLMVWFGRIAAIVVGVALIRSAGRDWWDFSPIAIGVVLIRLSA